MISEFLPSGFLWCYDQHFMFLEDRVGLSEKCHLSAPSV